jgi:hypothetical protein
MSLRRWIEDMRLSRLPRVPEHHINPDTAEPCELCSGEAGEPTLCQVFIGVLNGRAFVAPPGVWITADHIETILRMASNQGENE